MKRGTKILSIVIMAIICIVMCLHWGFMGVMCSACLYGLWAVNTPEE